MNHYVCCPCIVLSSTLHTGTNQLPGMKHDVQAEFWKAPEVFRKEGEQFFSMICSTFQICLQMQTRWPRGQTTHILDWLSWMFFGLLVLERSSQGNGRSTYIRKCSFIQIVSLNGSPAALLFGDRAGQWQLHIAVMLFWINVVGIVNLVAYHACCPTAKAAWQGRGGMPVVSSLLVTFGFWPLWWGVPSAETKE